MLKQSFDTTVGAMYLQVDERPVARTVEVSPRVFVDVAEDGRPVGLEVLGLDQAQPLIESEEIALALDRFEFSMEARRVLGAAVSPARGAVGSAGNGQAAQTA